MPLARGAGLEAAMTLDVLQAGLTITEVECEIRHKGHAADERTLLARANRYREVLTAVSTRRITSTVASGRASVGQRLRPHRREAATTEEDA